MILGGPIEVKFGDPESWIAAVLRSGYRAVFSPVEPGPDDNAAAYGRAALKAGIIIGEVGAWSNPIDHDPVKAREAIAKCQRSLDLAERIGARCCVNITGLRNPAQWDGPHPTNFFRETFEIIVETTREIIDAVKPRRTFYTLEAMPWIFPSSPDENLDLIRAVDRPGFGVHLDPVNMINCPARYYDNAGFLRECFAKLGPYIKSCHAKDIILREKLTVHLDECCPGTGFLDYGVYLRELSKLDPEMTLFMEHATPEEYPVAAKHIRHIAHECGLILG
jgi:sugar phosphate isomerase/epimerase